MCDLYTELNELGLLEYGSHITGELIRDLAGIKVPERGTWAEFRKVELQMLTLMGALRDLLLEDGKYLREHNGDYRILLPSENVDQVRKMLVSGDKKYRRAKKLLTRTPGVPAQDVQRDSVRILHKQDAISEMRDSLRMLK